MRCRRLYLVLSAYGSASWILMGLPASSTQRRASRMIWEQRRYLRWRSEARARSVDDFILSSPRSKVCRKCNKSVQKKSLVNGHDRAHEPANAASNEEADEECDYHVLSSAILSMRREAWVSVIMPASIASWSRSCNHSRPAFGTSQIIVTIASSIVSP